MFKTSEADIIQNKKDGVIYVADFPGEAGKYISKDSSKETRI